jgi:hypothetical protein
MSGFQHVLAVCTVILLPVVLAGVLRNRLYTGRREVAHPPVATPP